MMRVSIKSDIVPPPYKPIGGEDMFPDRSVVRIPRVSVKPYYFEGEYWNDLEYRWVRVDGVFDTATKARKHALQIGVKRVGYGHRSRAVKLTFW